MGRKCRHYSSDEHSCGDDCSDNNSCDCRKNRCDKCDRSDRCDRCDRSDRCDKCKKEICRKCARTDCKKIRRVSVCDSCKPNNEKKRDDKCIFITIN